MNSCSFYVEKFIYTKKDDKLDLSFIPANIRRRLSPLDKHILYMVNKFLDAGTGNIVLSSRYGEFKRLLSLIAQHEELNESSPMMFSASVHNYILGQFTMLKQTNIPTLAVSAGEMSFISGFVTAVTSPQDNVIYCFADDFENDIIGVCLKIRKNISGKSSYIINKAENTSDFVISDVIEFFENQKSRIELNGFSIERN